VEFNQSLLVDNIVNLMIILYFLMNYKAMTVFARPWKSFKMCSCLLSISGNQVQCVVSFVVMESIIHPNVPILFELTASVMQPYLYFCCCSSHRQPL
jgi:hypothetical protein